MLEDGDLIVIGNQLTLSTSNFYVVEVTFQDEIASGANTATITGVDAIGQISQFPISGEPGIYNNALEQIAALITQVLEKPEDAAVAGGRPRGDSQRQHPDESERADGKRQRRSNARDRGRPAVRTYRTPTRKGKAQATGSR